MSELFAGRYRILRSVGRGGMGEVSLARDLAQGGECAIKRLGSPSRSAFQEVRREFELLTRLRHPAVVSVYEFGTSPDGTPYYTMEYVPGVPADDAIDLGDWESLFFFAAEVAGALEALHSLPVFHGDLKPTNLLVIPGVMPHTLPTAVRLLDFGLAAALDSARGHRGTPGYAAPEVVRGEAIGPAADLYGLGSTLYTIGAGRMAFEGETADEILRTQRAGPPSALPLEEAGVPEPLIRLILRLMAFEPSERPQNAREVRRELESMHPAARRALDVRLQTAVFVGRERELAALERRRASASSGPRVVVITGESGIGKSALLTEIVRRWTVADRTVLHLACGSLPGRGEAGRALSRRLAAEAAKDRAANQPEANADPEPFSEIDGELDLTRATETAVAWHRGIARRAGTVIVLLDDVDHLDSVSRAFIRRLVLHPNAPPSLWIWTRRGRNADPAEDERALVEAGVAESIELGALDRPGTSRMVDARLNVPAPRDLEEFLWERARGHSGLTVELLRFAAQRGALRESDAGLVADAAQLQALDVPPTFEALLSVRYEALSPLGRTAAAALAVIGATSGPGRTGALERHVTATALEELLDSGLAIRDTAGSIVLASPAFAERLVSWLAPEVRRSLHRAALEETDLSNADRFRHLEGAGEVAEALVAAAAAYEERPDMGLASRAARLADSASVDLAGVWHERAGRELSRVGRYRGAIGHLERALEKSSSPEERRERLYLLSNALLRAGEPAEGARVDALALAENLPPAWRSRFLTNESSRLATMADLAGAKVAASEALLLAEVAADDEALGLAAQSASYLLLNEARTEEAEALARRAIAAFERVGDVRGRLRALGALGEVARTQRNLSAAERFYRGALAEARTEGLRLVVEELLVNLAPVLGHLGRWGEMRKMYAEAARLALEDERPRGATVAFASLAQVDGLMGNVRLARKEARAAIRLARAYHPRFESVGWRSLSQGYRIEGRLRRATRAARKALDLANRHAFGEEIDWCRVEFSRVLAESGRWKDAFDLCRHVVEAPPGEGTSGAATLGLLAGRAALRVKDLGAAQSRVVSAEEWLKGRNFPYFGGLLSQLKAEIALTRNRIPDALAHVDRASNAFIDLHAPAERSLALLEFGRLAIEGKSERISHARKWLEDAAAGFAQLGHRGGRERALELLVVLLKRSATGRRGERHERDLIESVSRLLHSLSDLKELTQRAMQLVIEQLDAERGVLLLADPESGRLVPMAEQGELDPATRSDAVGYSRGVVQRVTESGGSLLIGDAHSDPKSLSESMVHLGLRSIVCVPMFLSGRVIGAVYLDDSRRAQAFDDADRGLLEGFAHLMAIAIEKSRGEEEVRRTNEMLVGENLSLRQEAAVRFQAHRLIGISTEMQRVRSTIERVAMTTATVLLTGENGTGKELIARIVHHTSKRRLQPFVAINCGAIPESLIESELFGILSNVATQVRARDGRFKQADGGTLFLDEIGDMPLKQQVALLTAIANREITPVGGGKPISVDVRIMAATNRDLPRMVEDGTFREDLYYRLNVIPIEVPPLRDRKADIPMLVQHFVAQIAKRQERSLPTLAAEFLAALMQSDWPGNVREMQNYIERVMAMNPGDVLYPNPLPRDLEDRGAPIRASRGRGLTEMVEELERKTLEQALDHALGNQSLAARQLGITEQAMRYRMRKYGLGSARQNRRIRRFRHK